MPVKQFSIYSNNLEARASGDTLILEAGNLHIACFVKQNDNSEIAGFELFTFTKEEAKDFESVFSSVITDSRLLQKSYTATDLFINNELSVLVPAFKFNKEIAEDYLKIAFGEDGASIRSYDAINTDPVIMNVFRHSSAKMAIVNSAFRINKVSHVYSNIINQAQLLKNHDELLYVQFYHSHIIVCATQAHKVSFIQSFSYDTPDDVVYTLLNLTQQLKFTGKNLRLQISGMIDLSSNLYKELVTYFENVHADVIENAGSNLEGEKYPAHYFTPFYKLAI